MSEVRYITSTPDAEPLMAYCARVSSSDQENKSYHRLLKYCLDNGHWSVFEMADMTLEIVTSRAISAQILRHRSFCFQEFSQRYAVVSKDDYEQLDFRYQDYKNRQSSLPDTSGDLFAQFDHKVNHHLQDLFDLYQEMVEAGVAKECARLVLPMSTRTRLYMKGSVRSWIHYLQSRLHPSTQLEHQKIAWQCRDIFKAMFPVTSQVLNHFIQP